MRRQTLSVALFAAYAVGAQHSGLAQSASAAKPRFDVASVKECKNTDQPPPSSSSPGRLSLGCWPLWRLIADAYDTFASGQVDPAKPLVPWPIQGAPAWINSARYTIDAKAEDPASGAMMRGPMMQMLLEDRFQLRTRRETREVSVYYMTVAKGGLKLKPAAEGTCVRIDPSDLNQSPKNTPGGKPWCLEPIGRRNGDVTVFDVYGITLDGFSKLLRPDGLPVIDRTGLTGTYDIHLEWGQDPPAAATPSGSGASDPSPHSSAIEATREQLGIRLDPGRGPHEFLVIDHVERPTGN